MAVVDRSTLFVSRTRVNSINTNRPIAPLASRHSGGAHRVEDDSYRYTNPAINRTYNRNHTQLVSDPKIAATIAGKRGDEYEDDFTLWTDDIGRVPKQQVSSCKKAW